MFLTFTDNLRDLADYLIQLNDEMKESEDGPVKMEDRHFLAVLSDMFLGEHYLGFIILSPTRPSFLIFCSDPLKKF